MQSLRKLIITSAFLLISGCSSLLGVTGANEGRIIDDKWMEYEVIHPGLSITILEPYTSKLIPISTVGKSSPSPLKHTVLFGHKSNPHKLEIVGKYKKELYLDDQFYGSIYSGKLVIKDGVLMINNVLALPKKT